MTKKILRSCFSIPMIALLVSWPSLVQAQNGAAAQAPNWVCTLRVPNPIAVQVGNTPYFCAQWTDRTRFRALAGVSAMTAKPVLTLSGVTFGVAAFALSPQAKSQLDQLLAALAKQPAVKLRVIGHTDNVGAAQTNIKLSLGRANRVKDYLVSNGFDEAKIVTAGVGESQAIADNATAVGRMQNRRVEIYAF